MRIGTQGGTIGPSLNDVFERRTEAWLRNQIQRPREHNPKSAMPDFGLWYDFRNPDPSRSNETFAVEMAQTINHLDGSRRKAFVIGGFLRFLGENAGSRGMRTVRLGNYGIARGDRGRKIAA